MSLARPATFAAACLRSHAALTQTPPSGIWRFNVRGDSLIDELRLPDSTKFRDVRTTRSR